MLRNLSNRRAVVWAGMFLFLAGGAALAQTPPAGKRVITNSIGMKLVLIAPGSFQMGTPEGKSDQSDEKQHPVKLTKGFYLGVTEVTVGQFKNFVSDSGYKTEAETDAKGGYGFDTAEGTFAQDPKYNWKDPGFTQTDQHPVVNVTWNDAQRFLKWLGDKEKTSYRLPTEAEWEYACRAGTTTAYWHGDDPEGLAAVANVADASLAAKFPSLTTIEANDGHAFTAPVATYQPNPLGLLDMHGNVWEWCQDAYREDYEELTGTNPLHEDASAGVSRVIRGGGWRAEASGCRAAFRYRHSPAYRSNYFGFRVARSR